MPKKSIKILLLICFLSYPSIFLLSGGSTLKSDQTDLFKDLNNLAPSPFILLDEYSDSYIFLAVKRNQKLYILNNKGNSIQVENSYTCTTGEIIGDKQEEGDLKTPEGVYFIRSKIESSELPSKYGAGAYVLDYPNQYDTTKRKNGYGIWIHGTDDPERLNLSNNTRGCIIVKNEDFLDLSKYLELNRTPVIIVDEIQYRKIEYINSDKKEILDFFDKWEKSWETKNIDEYISLYSQKFRFRHMNIHRFKTYKKWMFNRYNWIELNISHLQIFRNEKYILINFIQEFSTDSFSDLGVKQLYVTRENNSYKIINEKWSEITEPLNNQ